MVSCKKKLLAALLACALVMAGALAEAMPPEDQAEPADDVILVAPVEAEPEEAFDVEWGGDPEVFFESEGSAGAPEYAAPAVYESALGDFELSSDGKALTKYTGSDEVVTIPAELGITRIDWNAFMDTNVTRVVVPEGVTALDAHAFDGAGMLASIKLPGTLTSMGAYAFKNCSHLESVAIPGSVKQIDAYAFKNCASLKSVSIDSGTTAIGNGAFSGCVRMSEITLPSTLTSLGDHVFKDCDALSALELPEGVSSLGNYLFSNCNGLKSVTVPRSVTSIGAGIFSKCVSPSMRVYYDSYARQYCEENGVSHSVIDPPHVHTVVTDAAVAPACTTDGLTEGSHCSVCGAVLAEQKTLPATGHSPVTDPGVDATCTTDGLTEGSHCSVCGAVLVEQQMIPAYGHTVVTDPEIEATPTASGLTEGSHCSVCGVVLVEQQEIPQIAIHMTKSTSKRLNVNDVFGIVVDGKTVKSYKSSNKKVASVTGEGVLTAKRPGTARITIKLSKKKKLTLKVKVVDPNPPTGVKITQGKKYTLRIGETLQLDAVLKPETAQAPLRWQSGNKRIAKVSRDGLVTARRKGRVKITVMTGNRKRATITIKVVK